MSSIVLTANFSVATGDRFRSYLGSQFFDGSVKNSTLNTKAKL
jgi:hypothetical protein